MKTYKIYHIPGVKIGCTTLTIEKRAEQQGYTDVELLETHTDIDIASNREKELQKQYNYKVDRMPYWASIENRPKWKIEHSSKGGKTNVKTGKVSDMGKIGGKIGGPIAFSIERTCEYCNKTMKGQIFFRFHGERCKQKQLN